MKQPIYTCPATGGELTLIIESEENGIITAGYFQNAENTKYPIKNGLPDFRFPAILSPIQQGQYNYYEENAENYDDVQGFTFALHNDDEAATRKHMVNQLQLKSDSKVLELACGTGKDSENIAALLDESGEFFIQDLSPAMIKQCQKKLAKFPVPVNFSIGNASYLSFPDNYFDAVFSFGGLNIFEDAKRSLSEMARVTKPGGRVVVGDESIPPWLADTEFSKLLVNTNPLLKFPLPLESLPVEARNVTVEWVIGGVYYLISFSVGVGAPTANYDLEIPGRRGGTLRTRYYGQLEGVSDEVKKLVASASKKSNTSIHKWLEQVLKAAAKEQEK